MRAVIAALSIVVAGCATNPYAEFYVDNAAGRGAAAMGLILSTDPPRVFRGSDPEQDDLRLVEDGYRLVGYSSFNSGNADEHGAERQARSVGASIILLYSEYTNTRSGATPLVLPSTQSSTTSIYGTSGVRSFSGTAQTTTRGTQTTFIPYNVDRFDHLATYWAKIPPPRFGVSLRDPTGDERSKAGTNVGLLVVAVIKDSPAFLADLFRHDLLKRVGEVDIRTFDDFRRAVDLNAGRSTPVIVVRNGKELTKQVAIRR